MVRIAISQAAFAAIARTAPFGSVSFENKTNEHGERLIWLDPSVVIASGPCAAPARATAMSSFGWRRRAAEALPSRAFWSKIWRPSAPGLVDDDGKDAQHARS
jgi:hypothetical protein